MPRKREPDEIEAQASRNIQTAIERYLYGLPKGESIDELWFKLSSVKGVSRQAFDSALRVLKTQERVRRIKDRLYPPKRR